MKSIEAFAVLKKTGRRWSQNGQIVVEVTRK